MYSDTLSSSSKTMLCPLVVITYLSSHLSSSDKLGFESIPNLSIHS